VKFYLSFFALLCCFVIPSSAQSGCTDPQATNYNAAASQNDGSCLYPETSYTLTQVADLPDQLAESSGLVYMEQGLYTHTDGGNPNEIYLLDTLTGEIVETLLVVGQNEDWEDMAESETHIFLGDFGNNPGNRTNLRIYKIAKAELGNTIINTQAINFFYTDQSDFSENQNNHNYDCEAFFYHNDSLHLFTKNWDDNQTRHYAIPAQPGLHAASPLATFDVDGLITSADISDNGTAILLGYTEVGLNFMWLLFDYQSTSFFSGNKRRIELGSGLVNSQTEAIAFKDHFSGYISSEQFDLGPIELPPKLLKFNIAGWIPDMMVNTTQLLAIENVQVFPNPFHNSLTISLSENWPSTETEIRLLNMNGKLLLTKKENNYGAELILTNMERFPKGMYVLQLFSEGRFGQAKVVR
jgi:Secretion system C-terminal sorting domain